MVLLPSLCRRQTTIVNTGRICNWITAAFPAQAWRRPLFHNIVVVSFMMTFSFVGGKFTRYFTVALPAVLITSAIGIQFVSGWISEKVSSWMAASWPANYLRLGLVVVVIIG